MTGGDIGSGGGCGVDWVTEDEAIRSREFTRTIGRSDGVMAEGVCGEKMNDWSAQKETGR